MEKMSKVDSETDSEADMEASSESDKKFKLSSIYLIFSFFYIKFFIEKLLQKRRSNMSVSLEATPKEILQELTDGKGYFLLKQVFSPEIIQKARQIIVDYSKGEKDTVTHFHGNHEEKINLQKRVWNLLSKNEIFVQMVLEERILEVVGQLLGEDFCMGSIAANQLKPGAPGQEPHVDYPYWDMFKKNLFPKGINGSFFMNCQATILLDDFTEENGATAIVPYTQKLCVYPTNEEEFYERATRTIGKAGDVVLMNGLTWHCAMPNHSQTDRIAILLQFLPKFIKPMENMLHSLSQDFLDQAPPRLRQLLGMDNPYPQIFDEVPSGNVEGKMQKNKLK